jgi:hypothetical protein
MRLAIFTRLSWKLALILGPFGAFCSASTIVSVTDSAIPVNRASFFVGGSNMNVVATSWTQAASFSNVFIDASLFSAESDFLSGTAYLMRAIGPGTTSASEVVAPEDFTAPFVGTNPVPLTVLFSGLNLGPGTYYLVLSAPFSNEIVGQSPLHWQIPTSPVITTAPSVTVGNGFEANTVQSTVDPFPPASSFLTAEVPMFDVTSVPEPKTSVVVLISLAALIFCRRRIWTN